MFKKLSSLGRAALLTALVLFVSVNVISCQKATDTPSENLPAGVYHLSANDPICGDFTGNMGDVYFHSDVAFATACSTTNIVDITGKAADSFFTFSVFDWNTYDYVNAYFEKDSNPVYVVYNKFDGSETADKHSGVIIFKAKYSPYGSPSVGSYYGVKFQFLEADKKVPEKRTEETVYTKDVLIEGGYNNDYNNVTDLAKAVEMFAYNNTDYFTDSSWNWNYSGASKK